MNRLITITILALLSIARAQEIPPELTQLRTPYQQAVTTIRANTEARVKPITASYLAALERLGKQLAGDPAVAAERERVAAGTVPSKEEVAKMVGPLGQLRAKFDADMKAAKAPFAQQEAQYTRQYLSSLNTLERRFTSQNAIPKAAAVTEEIQKLNPASGQAPAASKGEKGNAESTITAGTTKAIGSLDPALAGKIAAAVEAKAYTKSLYSNNANSEQGPLDAPKVGGLLVGFEYYQPYSAKDDGWIRSLRPYFLTKEGVVAGMDRGIMDKVNNKIMARPGYAIAGLLVTEETEIQAIFMKLDPATGQFLTGSGNTYKSQEYGTKGKAKPKLLGGDGRLVIGVYGRVGANTDGIGLVLMNKP